MLYGTIACALAIVLLLFKKRALAILILGVYFGWKYVTDNNSVVEGTAAGLSIPIAASSSSTYPVLSEL